VKLLLRGPLTFRICQGANPLRGAAFALSSRGCANSNSCSCASASSNRAARSTNCSAASRSSRKAQLKALKSSVTAILRATKEALSDEIVLSSADDPEKVEGVEANPVAC